MTTSPSPRTLNRTRATTSHEGGHRTTSVRHFVRHYVEMVVAMVLGMVILGAPAAAVLHAVGGRSAAAAGNPAVILLGMAITMTVPMVAWMRYRGHRWQASAEMSAAMFVPTLVAILVHLAGLVDDVDLLVLAEHVVMLVAMLVVMLRRPSEYMHRPAAH